MSNAETEKGAEQLAPSPESQKDAGSQSGAESSAQDPSRESGKESGSRSGESKSGGSRSGSKSSSSGSGSKSGGSKSGGSGSSKSSGGGSRRDKEKGEPGKGEEKKASKWPERFPIDRSFEVESARRGLETLPWSLRLMSGSTFLLAASVVFSLSSVFFAYRQAPAEIYVATVDGGLFLAPSVMNPHGLQERFEELDAETTSLKRQSPQPQAAAPKQQLPTPASQSTGPTTEALSAPDADAVGPATLGGAIPGAGGSPGLGAQIPAQRPAPSVSAPQ